MQARAAAVPLARRRSSSASVGAKKERGDAPDGIQVGAEELQCSICFDVLTFPVTLPCGHNFDRGCILTAWAFEAPSGAGRGDGNDLDGGGGDSDSDDSFAEGLLIMQPLERSRGESHPEGDDAAELSAHSCPLCRQHVWLTEPTSQLQLNRPLQGVVSSLFPIESERAGTPDKQQPRSECSHEPGAPREEPPVEPVAPRVETEDTTDASGGLVEFLRRPCLRTLSSLLSVSVASLYTIPPGFTLAMLLLLALAAIACAPPATFGVATSSAASPVLLLTMEAVDRVCNGLGLLIRDLSMQLDQPLAQVVHLVAVLW